MGTGGHHGRHVGGRLVHLVLLPTVNSSREDNTEAALKAVGVRAVVVYGQGGPAVFPLLVADGADEADGSSESEVGFLLDKYAVPRDDAEGKGLSLCGRVGVLGARQDAVDALLDELKVPDRFSRDPDLGHQGTEMTLRERVANMAERWRAAEARLEK